MKAPTFTNYAEAQAWIAEGQAKHGKRAFSATDEYKAAYSQIADLYAKENGVKRRRKPRVERPIFGSSLIVAFNR